MHHESAAMVVVAAGLDLCHLFLRQRGYRSRSELSAKDSLADARRASREGELTLSYASLCPRWSRRSHRAAKRSAGELAKARPLRLHAPRLQR